MSDSDKHFKMVLDLGRRLLKIIQNASFLFLYSLALRLATSNVASFLQD